MDIFLRKIDHIKQISKKIKFYKDLEKHIRHIKKKSNLIIVMGDYNVAPSDLDIGIGEQNVKRWLRDEMCFST